MTITVSVPDQLALEAQAHGLSVEAFVEQLAARALPSPTAEENGGERAVEALLAFRHTHQLRLDRDRASSPRAWLDQDHKR